MISIVGAGPVGSYCAFLLAKKGFDVQLFEEHKETGKPVQCTGIVTDEIKDFISLNSKCVINRLEKARLFLNNHSIELPAGTNYILDRAEFDKEFSKRAEKAGAEILYNHKFMDYKKGTGEIILKYKNKIKRIRTDFLIGADGPLSSVAKSCGLFKRREFYFGVQAVARLKNPNTYFEVHLGRLAPDFFGWVVPESEGRVRIGLASKEFNAKDLFNTFINKKLGTNKKVLEIQAGLIPIYNPKIITQKGHVYLVGDAACQVKASTGGGLVPGLQAAEILADSIKNREDYGKAWKKSLGFDLWIHLKLRNLLNNFSEKDYKSMYSLLAQHRIKRVLKRNSRDYPKRLLFKMLFLEPRFLYFSKYLI